MMMTRNDVDNSSSWMAGWDNVDDRAPFFSVSSRQNYIEKVEL